jgi:hypothetical protein
MKEDTSSKSSTSAETSTSAHEKQNDKHGDEKSLSESELLQREAADAMTAMKAAWADLKHSAGGAVDIRRWTWRYPWIATASALAAGVAAGYVLTPRDRDEAKELWEKIKAKFAGKTEDRDTIYVEPAKGHTESEHSSFVSTILRGATKVVLPFVTGMMGAAAGTQTGEPDHNGKDAS